MGESTTIENVERKVTSRFADKVLLAYGAIVLTFLAWIGSTLVDNGKAIEVLIESNRNTQRFIETYGPTIIENKSVLRSHLSLHEK